jgi:transcriptional regulator with XRE-family HTH domain
VETLDIIKQLCSNKGITVSQLENELEYGNGSIAKSKSGMSAERMYQIAQYFKVPMEYLMTGKTISETDDEMALIRQQQSILLEISKTSQELTDLYKKIDDCKERLLGLKKDYNKLEVRKKQSNDYPIDADSIGFSWDGIEEELPFN